MRLFSLEGKVFAGLGGALSVAIALNILLLRWLDSQWLAGCIALLIMLALGFVVVRLFMRPVIQLLRALTGSAASFRDGDFSFSIRVNRYDELGDLAQAHNDLGRVLREERQNLFQRELLLDTVVQQTPTVLVLVDSADRVIYANLAAQQLLNAGQSLNGMNFAQLINQCPAPLAQAVANGEDGLFTALLDQQEESFHFSRRDFRLQRREHRLYLIKRLTRELSRQEVQTWKKVIRIISHELNNSLAPISSLAHSGRELLRKHDFGRMAQVFDIIEERVRHLDGFLRGYAEFSKLPQPLRDEVAWRPFLDALAQHTTYRLIGTVPQCPGWFDRIQMEQVLINLLKNAQESGSSPDAIELRVAQDENIHIDVYDRGGGMNEAVLASALLPFYSTKRSGSGLGLALAREIIEAHGGRIALANREQGGLRVSLSLPLPGTA